MLVTPYLVASRCRVLGRALHMHKPVLFTHHPGTHATVRIPCFQVRKLSSERLAAWPASL